MYEVARGGFYPTLGVKAHSIDTAKIMLFFV